MKNMTMNNRDVKSVFVKLIAGIVLALMLVSVAAPVAFAAEEGEQQTTAADQTEAETEAETEGETEGEAEAPETTVDFDQLVDIAVMLKSNDAARQLFLAACGKNATGTYYKYDGSYLNDKKEFEFNSALSSFVAVDAWDAAYALQILEDANNLAKDKAEIPETMTEADAGVIIEKMKDTVDLENKGNILDTVLRAIGYVLNLATKYLTFGTNNYLLSLLYFGLVIEILMLPFAISQQKNSIKQAKLRPKEMAIRKRYAGRNDQATMQKVNQEIQELYQKEHFNPMSGCLPLLIQLPIVMALYYVVIDPMFYVLGQAKAFSGAIIQYFTTSQAAGGFGGTLSSDRGTIEILSKLRVEDAINQFASLEKFEYFTNSVDLFDALKQIVADGIPSFNIGGWNFGLTPWSAVTSGMEFLAQNWWLFLVPVLTFVVYFSSMKISRKLTYQPTTSENDKATGCSNNMMDFMMPLMSVYIAFIVPAAVGVYWMFKSVLGTIKQLIMKKAMPIPVFTEADYKAAEKEMYGKNPPKAPKSSGSRNPNVRSLHHIDDDEYDAKGNYIGRTEQEEQPADADESKKNQKAPAMAEPLKDESDKKQNDTDSDDTTNS